MKNFIPNFKLWEWEFETVILGNDGKWEFPLTPQEDYGDQSTDKDFQKMKIVKNKYVLRQPEQYEEQWRV